MAAQKFLNNFDWQFIGPVTAGTHVGYENTIGRGVLQINDAASAMLGTLTGGDWYVLTAYKRSGSVESAIEILKVLGVNEGAYAAPGECRIRVERGHEGTTPQTYVAGDLISMRLTAGGLNDLASDAELATKQDTLVSGSNIKTINSASLLGSGDVTLQPTLVSGTNIKTVGGVSLLGSGDVPIGAGDVVGPASATDNTLPRFDGTTGKLIQGSGVYVDDSNNLGVGAASTGAKVFATAAGAGYELKQQTAGSPAYYVMDNTVESGGKRWRFGYSGAAPLTTFSLYNQTDNVTAWVSDASGNFTVNAGALGYGTGAGGSANQPTSRTTSVTLNKPSGAITMASAAGSATRSQFYFYNSFISATDTVSVSVKQGASNYYLLDVVDVQAGACVIVFATTGSTAVDAPVINFAVIKGATA